MDTLWPTIEQGYCDAEGFIELDVYNAAASLWTPAKKLVRVMFNDEALAHRLMLKAAAIVTRVRAERGDHIRHLRSYLWATFRHLLCEESRKGKSLVALAPDCERSLLQFFTDDSVAGDVQRNILLGELVDQMDPWTRKVFDLLVVGYNFEEITELLGENIVVRNRFYTRLKRLARSLNLPPPDT